MSLKKKSQYLALLLRHKPEKANLYIDQYGWVSIKDLLKNTDISMDEISEIVDTNDKRRYELSDDQKYIRALQGHSIPVNLELQLKIPPDTLYHGTKHDFLNSIKEQGLCKMKRNHVHLSADVETATNVGSRRNGSLVILEIDAKQMIEDNYQFFISKNNVWLIEAVPPKYIKINLVG